MRYAACGLTLLTLALLAGCGGDESSGPVPWNVAESSVETTVALERAKEAAGALGGQLVKRLTAAVESGGFVNALDVCKVDAPRIAAEVGAEQGVRIGRTSHLIRSPDNAPPAWAAAAVAAGAGKKAKDVKPLAFRNKDGEFGVLLPIPTKGMCLVCHGEEGALEPDLAARLTELYPDDRAKGFADGDLRGWFWVETAAK